MVSLTAPGSVCAWMRNGNEEHAQLNSGSKKQDVEGLRADVETEIIDERERDKDKPLEPQKEAVALSRREKESFRQFSQGRARDLG